jgi:hypothetical protein
MIMRKISLPVLPCMLVLLFLQIKSTAQINLVQDYKNYTSATIGFFQNISFREGGFSGLYPIPNTNGKEFWTCSDRGVNVDAATANPAGCTPTYDKIFSFPNYAPKIHRIRLNGDSVQILQTITMKRPNGTAASGIINPTGLGSTAAEVASTDTVLDCANFNSKIAAKDVWGIDAEGLVVDKDGNFWICEEGGATIWKLNQNGVVVNRFTPYANLPGMQPQDVQIDTVFKYRKNNRGFEGIAITPNGKIYAIIQSPILYPTTSVGENTRIHRILEIDPSTNAMRMFAYLNDGIIGPSGGNQIRLRDWKIGDMAAINNTTFLVLEAALRGTTNIQKMYLINIENATPVHSGLYSGKTLEALVDAAGLAANGITPVTKTLFMDLQANGWPIELEKAEDLAIINDSTIVIGNDNDYGQVSVPQNGIATATGILSHDIKYSLKGNNKLSSFQFSGTTLSQGITAQSSSQSPYLVPSIPNAYFTSIITAKDAVNGYKMVGIPDGLGAFDNNNGTFTVVMNHEIGTTGNPAVPLGINRAHGSAGAFVSKWIVNKSDLTVVSGSDLIQNIKLWNPATSTYTTFNAASPSPLAALNRLCSADLPAISAFYNSTTGLGTQERIFMNGEESGNEGRAFGHIITGLNAGTSYELPHLGKFSWENSVANPATGNKTVVAGMDDATPGQVYFYIGTKTNTGTEIDKAGLSNGKLFGPAVSGLLTEISGSIPAPNTPFTMKDLGSVQNITGATLNTNSNTAGVTQFLRPEDGAWDPSNPNDFYFVTTNAFNSPSRLWKLHFTNLNDLTLGGTITAVLDGTEGQQMFDNITIDNSGHILLQEDVGNNAHIGKIWQYNIATDALTQVAQHDPTRFLNGGALFLTQDEESSGIIDVQSILGPGMFLADVQAHFTIPGEIVEGGQLLAYFNPDTYNSNPEINLISNNITITDGDITPSASDNTDFGNVNPGDILNKTFVIQNTGLGNLMVSGINFTGINAAQFTLMNAPAFPVTIAPNGTQTITVRFAPVAAASYSAILNIINNDFNEGTYDVALHGMGVCAAYTTNIIVSPNPTVPNQLSNTIYLGYGPQNVNLAATVTNSFAPYNYTWSPVSSTSNMINVSPITTTNYTVIVLNTYGCPSTANQTITVMDIRDGNKNKVFICHNGHTLTISVNAVADHLTHGDYLGDCNAAITRSNAPIPEQRPTTIMLYPNPARNNTFIQINPEKDEQVSIVVYDVTGKTVVKPSYKNLKSGDQLIELNTSSLNNGVYFVKVTGSNTRSTMKLLVIH